MYKSNKKTSRWPLIGHPKVIFLHFSNKLNQLYIYYVSFKSVFDSNCECENRKTTKTKRMVKEIEKNPKFDTF